MTTQFSGAQLLQIGVGKKIFFCMYEFRGQLAHSFCDFSIYSYRIVSISFVSLY